MGIRRNLWVSNMNTETLATSDHALVRYPCRLGIIYSQTTNRFPARHYDAHLGEESGLFREFVILAFEAAGISDKPPDTLIRSIWGGLPKKIRARKNYGD